MKTLECLCLAVLVAVLNLPHDHLAGHALTALFFGLWVFRSLRETYRGMDTK